LDSHGDLFAPLRVRPTEFLSHYVNDSRQGIESGLSIEEGKAGTASNDIDGSLRIFVANGVSDFSLDDCLGRLIGAVQS